MQFANCAALAATLYADTALTTNICLQTENLRHCSSAEDEIVLNLFLTFEKKWASCSYCSYKKVYLHNKVGTILICSILLFFNVIGYGCKTGFRLWNIFYRNSQYPWLQENEYYPQLNQINETGAEVAYIQD